MFFMLVSGTQYFSPPKFSEPENIELHLNPLSLLYSGKQLATKNHPSPSDLGKTCPPFFALSVRLTDDSVY